MTPPLTMTSCHQFIPRDAGRAFRSTLFHQMPDYSRVKIVVGQKTIVEDFVKEVDDENDEVFKLPLPIVATIIPATCSTPSESMRSSMCSSTMSTSSISPIDEGLTFRYRNNHRYFQQNYRNNHYQQHRQQQHEQQQQQRHSDGSLRDRSSLSSNENEEV